MTKPPDVDLNKKLTSIYEDDFETNDSKILRQMKNSEKSKFTSKKVVSKESQKKNYPNQLSTPSNEEKVLNLLSVSSKEKEKGSSKK